MTDSVPRWRRRLFKAVVVIAFAGGLSLFGAALGVYNDEGCFRVPFLNHCGEARWAMALGAVLAIWAVVALWVRTLRRGHS